MKRVLVIEDEDEIRSNLLELLEIEGFDAMGGENGWIGLKLAREHLPSLIISDVMMPELDGYGVLEELRRDPVTATIPFIFLTARAERADLRQGMELGADDYLTKPFARDELLKAIDTRLAKQNTVEQKFQKQLEDLRGSITLSLPHELRTPLTGILGFSAVLVESYDMLAGREILEIAQVIQTSAERLHRLVENYLLYADLEILGLNQDKVAALQAMAATSQLKPVVTQAALDVARKAGRETDLKLDLHDATVSMSQGYLKKSAEELIGNAFKFSKAGTPVHVTSRADTDRVTLTIIDQGRGMTAQQIAAVGAYMQFERRLHEQQGAGLGLIIAKRLAEVYGGELSIESQSGQGTTAHVTLPTAQ